MRPQLERVPLTGDCAEVDRNYDLSGVVHPVQLLETLRSASAKVGAARFRPEELVTASLVRFCTQVHRRGMVRSLPEGRSEAVWRRVWLPEAKALGAQALRLTAQVVLDEHGIGGIAVPGSGGGALRRPALSVPLTAEESSSTIKLAVPAMSGTDAEHSVYVLLHPIPGSRQVVEQVLHPMPPAGAPM